jgi:hypothetical protein
VKKDHGQVLSLPPYQGRIHADYDHPVFLKAISDCQKLLDDPLTRIILDSRNRIGVAILSVDDQETKEVVIKEFRIRGINKVKSFFLPSKSLKAWRGGMILVEGGIQTPFPIAHIEKRKGFFLAESYYLAEFVDQLVEIRALFCTLPEDCYRKGIIHRDLSDGNILVKRGKEDQYAFYLTDTNRIRARSIIFFKGVKYLIRLGIPFKFQKFFLSKYSGKTPVQKRLWLWYRINKTIYTHYVELKKRLRLKQISQWLKIQ